MKFKFMRAIISIALSLLLVTQTGLFYVNAEEEVIKIDILATVSQGQAAITASSYDIGSPQDCFDFDTSTLMRSANVNPAFVKITFNTQKNIKKLRVLLGELGYPYNVNSWSVEAADNETDLQAMNGTYSLVVSTRGGVAGDWDEVNLTSAVSRKIWKFTITRTSGDDYVHIPELELWDLNDMITAPQISSISAYYSSASIQWSQLADSRVANYYIFKRTASGTYDYNNPAGIAGIDSTKSVLTFNDFGLTPGTQYYYRIAAYSATGRISSYSSEVSTQTATSSANYSRVSNLKLLVAVYTTDMTNVTRSINAIKKAIEFYYRNSNGRLNLEPTFMYIDSLAPDTSDTSLTNVEVDLRARGVKDNQFDGIFVLGTNLNGYWGGHCILGSTFGGFGYAEDKGNASSYFKDHDDGALYSGQVWIFVHEFGHGLDALSDSQGYNMLFNHFPWMYPDIKTTYPTFLGGEHYDGMAQVLRLFDDYENYTAPHNDYIEYLDTDHDLIADNDSRLPIDEVGFGTSNSLSDTDGDGLNDMGEYSAGIYGSSNPLQADTDADGITDGNDETPLCDFSSTIKKFQTSPAINGVIDSSWTKLASKPAFQLDSTLTATYYAGWDNNYFYVGVKSNKRIKVWMSLDGSGSNGIWESDGYFAASGTNNWNNVQYSDLAYGDCYETERGNKALFVDPDNQLNKVFMGPNSISDSQVAITGPDANGLYTMTFKFTKDLGPGADYSYWGTEASSNLLTGIKLEEDRVFGLQFTYAPVNTVIGITAEWNGSWSSMGEPLHYYLSKLVPATTSDGNLKVQMYNLTRQSSTNTINPRFQLFNTGTTSINLANVKLRYYFTADGTQQNEFWVDYATCGSANVGGNFYPVSPAKTGADTYLEVGFTSSAGTLAAGTSTEVQVRFNKTDWTNFNQSNDYSFNSTDSSYVDWNKVTAYLSDIKQWGIEP